MRRALLGQATSDTACLGDAQSADQVRSAQIGKGLDKSCQAEGGSEPTLACPSVRECPLSRDEPVGTEASVLGSLESNDDVRATIEGSRFAARLDLDLEKALVPCIVTRGEEVRG